MGAGRVEVVASGTLAFSTGPVFDPEGKRTGTFNSTWRLEKDGEWRVVLDSGCPPCQLPLKEPPMTDHVRVCRDCGEEYRPEIVRCADCGGELEDRYEGETDESPSLRRRRSRGGRARRLSRPLPDPARGRPRADGRAAARGRRSHYRLAEQPATAGGGAVRATRCWCRTRTRRGAREPSPTSWPRTRTPGTSTPSRRASTPSGATSACPACGARGGSGGGGMPRLRPRPRRGRRGERKSPRD